MCMYMCFVCGYKYKNATVCIDGSMMFIGHESGTLQWFLRKWHACSCCTTLTEDTPLFRGPPCMPLVANPELHACQHCSAILIS